MLKLRYYEKATKFEKNLQLGLTKQLFLLNSVKTSGRFFSDFCSLLRKAEIYQQLMFPSFVVIGELPLKFLAVKNLKTYSFCFETIFGSSLKLCGN